MKLELVKKLVFALIIGVSVVACVDDPNDDYTPPTVEEELAYLSDYIDTLEARGFDVDTTDLGVYYVIDSIGDGDFPYDDDTLTVKYTGFFINGQVFDYSSNDGFDVVLGLTGPGSVIEGWNDGLKQFNKGGRGYLIIPSEFAYGEAGFPNGYGGYSIPPNTTLVFTIEVLDILFAN